MTEAYGVKGKGWTNTFSFNKLECLNLVLIRKITVNKYVFIK